MFDLNPLDVLKQRELHTLPPHFSKIKISESDSWDGNIEKWIKAKLKGRFCVVKSPSLEQDGRLKTITYVGFEDHKELTFFMLACPYLRRN